MSVPTRVKICPQCQQPAPVEAQWCVSCNHQFRTKFAPDVAQTQMLPPSNFPATPVYPVAQQPPPPSQYPQMPPQYQPVTPPPIYLNPPVGVIQKMPGSHSPGMAALISFFVTGGGQVYNGQTGKGITLLMAAICLGLISYGILGGVIWVITLIDAICVGNKLNQGRLVSKWEFF